MEHISRLTLEGMVKNATEVATKATGKLWPGSSADGQALAAAHLAGVLLTIALTEHNSKVKSVLVNGF